MSDGDASLCIAYTLLAVIIAVVGNEEVRWHRRVGRRIRRTHSHRQVPGNCPPTVRASLPTAVLIDSDSGLANASMRQRLVPVRLFYDHLMEDGLPGPTPSAETATHPAAGATGSSAA